MDGSQKFFISTNHIFFKYINIFRNIYIPSSVCKWYDAYKKGVANYIFMYNKIIYKTIKGKL